VRACLRDDCGDGVRFEHHSGHRRSYGSERLKLDGNEHRRIHRGCHGRDCGHKGNRRLKLDRGEHGHIQWGGIFREHRLRSQRCQLGRDRLERYEWRGRLGRVGSRDRRVGSHGETTPG
jgi:hypothetical protein